MTMEQGARETCAAAMANSVPAAAGAAGDYLTNEEATEMLRGANSGVKPELGRRLYRVVKRTVDIVAAGGALVLLFIPGVILSMVICIKSPGASPLYSQWRVGRVRKDGTFYLFKIYKVTYIVQNEWMLPVSLMGFGLFFLFLGYEWHSPLVNRLARWAFPCYLINAYPAMKMSLWSGVFRLQPMYDSPLLIVSITWPLLATYLVSGVAEEAKALLFRLTFDRKRGGLFEKAWTSRIARSIRQILCGASSNEMLA